MGGGAGASCKPAFASWCKLQPSKRPGPCLAQLSKVSLAQSTRFHFRSNQTFYLFNNADASVRLDLYQRHVSRRAGVVLLLVGAPLPVPLRSRRPVVLRWSRPLAQGGPRSGSRRGSRRTLPFPSLCCAAAASSWCSSGSAQPASRSCCSGTRRRLASRRGSVDAHRCSRSRLTRGTTRASTAEIRRHASSLPRVSPPSSRMPHASRPTLDASRLTTHASRRTPRRPAGAPAVRGPGGRPLGRRCVQLLRGS